MAMQTAILIPLYGKQRVALVGLVITLAVLYSVCSSVADHGTLELHPRDMNQYYAMNA